jgi:hypothetical protein
LNVYYVTSKLDDNVKEGYRVNKDFGNFKQLIPSISENINLNKSIKNNQLNVNIYIFTYDTFFREYLTSKYKIFSRDIYLDRNNKL